MRARSSIDERDTARTVGALAVQGRALRNTRPVTAATKIERSGPAIRAALAETSASECAQFEAELTAALQRATTELDLAPAEQVLDRWWGIAAIRTNPLTEAEREQLTRARAGDFTGLWERDEAGNWVQL
jgi:Family of unknown function (DUF6247)